MSDTPEDRDLAMLRKHINELGEHFDTVHIFATRHEPSESGGTISAQSGCGNWHARYGQVAQWLIRQDERERIEAREESKE